MMTKFFLFAFVCFTFFSCKTKDAFDYNQKLVSMEKGLTPYIETTETKVSAFANTGSYDSIASVAGRMEKMIEDKLDSVRKMSAPSVKEGDNFKKAYINYFEYMKSLYTSYRKFGESTTQEGREAESKRMLALANNKAEVLADMQTAQKKYADANGFKLEK